MRKLLIVLALLLAVMLAGCGGGDTVVVTATPLPVTDVPMPTIVPTEILPIGDPDCFGTRFPNGYFWVSANHCLRGEIHQNELWDEYDIDDERIEYWFGDTVTPYQYVIDTANEFGGIQLSGVPAYIFAVRDDIGDPDAIYRGVDATALNIEITELNGRFGVQYAQDFVPNICYNFKFYVRFNITQQFDPDVADIRLQVHDSNGESTNFNIHSIRNPLGEWEYTWVGFTRDVDVSGAVLMYIEIRNPQMRGNVFVYSAGTLRGPQAECFDANGDAMPDAIEF